MSVNSIGGINYSYAQNFQGGKTVNPRRDPVFIDPKTGEKTTWKPGIYDPEAEEKIREKASKLKKLLMFGTLGILAFIFRGKIKSGIDFVKGLFKK